MRKILFLDIDGVLVTFPEVEVETELDMFNTSALGELERILDTIPEIEIVISSSWRIGRTLDQLKDVFIQNKFRYSERIIDVTPRIYKFRKGKIQQYSSAPRGCEVSAWLDDHMYTLHPELSYQEDIRWRDANPFNYAILDDDGDMLYDQRLHFVQTKVDVGITKENADEIIRILK